MHEWATLRVCVWGAGLVPGTAKKTELTSGSPVGVIDVRV